MRIDRLHVKNFKGFEDRDFEFPLSATAESGSNGSFHLIIGQNGKGKTSVLDALAVAAGCWFLGIRGQVSRHILPEDVRVRVVEYGDTERLENQLPVTVEAKGLVQGQRVGWKRELRSRKTDSVNAKTIKNLAEQAVSAVQNGEEVTLPLISYYGTGRLWQEPRDMGAATKLRIRILGERMLLEEPRNPMEENLSDEFASRLAGYHLSIDPRCSPRELLRWLKFEQQLSVQEMRDSHQFAIVKQAILESVEGCLGVKYHLRLGLLLDVKEQPRLPFSALSDGQRNMVAMIGDLAYKAAQLNPHLGRDVLKRTPGVVLIDELDLHLHPRWQRHVVEDLRRIFPEVQFIATTHSPFIVQTLREGELIPLDTQPVSETYNLGVEEIARGLMAVEHPEVGPRYDMMRTVAKNYLEMLEEAPLAPQEKLEEFKQQLAEAIAPFADNPAFQAFLEMKRAAKLGE